MSYLDFQQRIKQWAMDRNLIEGSSPLLQMTKLWEECEELSHALQDRDIPGTVNEDGNMAEVVDAIGDTQVVLAVMCAQLGLDIDACREAAWLEIKDRKGKMVDGVFVKELQNGSN